MKGSLPKALPGKTFFLEESLPWACPCFPPCHVRTRDIKLGWPPGDYEGLSRRVEEILALIQASQLPPSNHLQQEMKPQGSSLCGAGT